MPSIYLLPCHKFFYATSIIKASVNGIFTPFTEAYPYRYLPYFDKFLLFDLCRNLSRKVLVLLLKAFARLKADKFRYL